jgi:hypothetical protein
MPTPTCIPEGIRSGLNAGAVEIAGAVAVRRIIGSQAGLPADVDDPLWGVTMAPIPVASWGDVQTRGVAIVTAGAGGFTEGDRLMAEPFTGKAVKLAAAGSASVLGIALTTTPADGRGEVELAGPAASHHA